MHALLTPCNDLPPPTLNGRVYRDEWLKNLGFSIKKMLFKKEQAF